MFARRRPGVRCRCRRARSSASGCSSRSAAIERSAPRRRACRHASTTARMSTSRAASIDRASLAGCRCGRRQCAARGPSRLAMPAAAMTAMSTARNRSPARRSGVRGVASPPAGNTPSPGATAATASARSPRNATASSGSTASASARQRLADIDAPRRRWQWHRHIGTGVGERGGFHAHNRRATRSDAAAIAGATTSSASVRPSACARSELLRRQPRRRALQ